MSMEYVEIHPAYTEGGYTPAVYGWVPKDAVFTLWPKMACPQCGNTDWEFSIEDYEGICWDCVALWLVDWDAPDIPLSQPSGVDI